jgi:hypothetical protein
LGTLLFIVVGAAVAFAAYKAGRSTFATAQRKKVSVELESFVQACVYVDDQATFARNYALVVSNAPLLERAFLSRDGKFLLGIEAYDAALPAAIDDVLTTLDSVATIVRYATSGYTANEKIVDERTKEVIIKAHGALSFVIAELQQDDPQRFERFDELYKYCMKRRAEYAALAGR